MRDFNVLKMISKRRNQSFGLMVRLIQFLLHSLQIRRLVLVLELVVGVVLVCVYVVALVVVEELWRWWRVMREQRRYERCRVVRSEQSSLMWCCGPF